ncbi:aminoglycoside phosphotransferase family protein [Antarctobacter heliothermus]|uniref:Phosphotransferase enzyme family protein n=1 Tax=Antarctobacter heliothermus TaxID=74033 RepID=A0A239AWU4_9RHOB|nr:aminoglycoside phosphotransferase family protein [Antarctobacter heliothermus]SNR99448.1 Phosphotransferase enzyme family protein [Antarctobacter heliothermus]
MSLTAEAARASAIKALAHHGGGSEPRAARPGGGAAHLFATDTPEGPILIKVWADADRAARQARRQTQVARVLNAGDCRAPKVLFFDEPCRAMAMPTVNGTDLAALWRAGREDVPGLSGQWLAAFHGLTRRPCPFDPTGQVNWLSRLVAAALDGQRAIPDPAGFAKVARGVQAMADGVSGCASARAVTHRDMTLSNLMLDVDGTIWGLDFENTRVDEPLRDVFTLALDLMTLGAQDGKDAVARLVRRYGDGDSDPAVRLFLQRCFCLWVWANTPATPSARQLHRLEVAEDLLHRDDPVI